MADTVNISLIKQAVLTKQANKRQANSAVKTRGKVRGGGKKPWKQKGTGRARAGTSRSPLWVGGGITFGPTKERNYSYKLPKKMQKAAMTELLKLRKSAIMAVDSLALKELKTKAAVALLKKHNLAGKLILVTKETQPELLVATNNLPNVQVIGQKEFSIDHLTDGSTIVMEQAVYDLYFPKPAVKKAPAKSKKESEA